MCIGHVSQGPIAQKNYTNFGMERKEGNKKNRLKIEEIELQGNPKVMVSLTRITCVSLS